MCLAVPARIIQIEGDIATVEVEGIRRTGNVSLVPDVQIGDYVLVHAGFAIQKWSEADVLEYNAIIAEMQGLDESTTGNSRA